MAVKRSRPISVENYQRFVDDDISFVCTFLGVWGGKLQYLYCVQMSISSGGYIELAISKANEVRIDCQAINGIEQSFG
jgi:hypothetical protein